MEYIINCPFKGSVTLVNGGRLYNHEHDEYIHGAGNLLLCIEVASGIKITIYVNDGLWYNHDHGEYIHAAGNLLLCIGVASESKMVDQAPRL